MQAHKAPDVRRWCCHRHETRCVIAIDEPCSPRHIAACCSVHFDLQAQLCVLPVDAAPYEIGVNKDKPQAGRALQRSV